MALLALLAPCTGRADDDPLRLHVDAQLRRQVCGWLIELTDDLRLCTGWESNPDVSRVKLGLGYVKGGFYIHTVHQLGFRVFQPTRGYELPKRLPELKGYWGEAGLGYGFHVGGTVIGLGVRAGYEPESGFWFDENNVGLDPSAIAQRVTTAGLEIPVRWRNVLAAAVAIGLYLAEVDDDRLLSSEPVDVLPAGEFGPVSATLQAPHIKLSASTDPGGVRHRFDDGVVISREHVTLDVVWAEERYARLDAGAEVRLQAARNFGLIAAAGFKAVFGAGAPMFEYPTLGGSGGLYAFPQSEFRDRYAYRLLLSMGATFDLSRRMPDGSFADATSFLGAFIEAGRAYGELQDVGDAPEACYGVIFTSLDPEKVLPSMVVAFSERNFNVLAKFGGGW